ncbi:MAG: elongation factor G-like protein EF-G2 [Frankia sp.]
MRAIPCDTRNVVLVGHSGVGKTALTSALRRAAALLGANGGTPAGGAARGGDSRGRTINLTLTPVVYRGLTINLLDTPGYVDFIGEMRAGLRAADAALFVVSALDDIDGATRALWRECGDIRMPRAIAVTKLDHPRADFDAALGACREAFGAGVVAAHVPLSAPDQRGVGGTTLDLLSGALVDYADDRADGRPRRDGNPAGSGAGSAVPAEHLAARGALIEGIIAESEDESLLDRYLGGEELDTKMLLDDLETAVARGAFYPVLPAAGVGLFGAADLLEMFVGAFPSPSEHPLPTLRRPDGSPVPALTMADPDGPLLAEIVKTTTDAYVGRLSMVRVFSGTLRPDTDVHVSGHGRAAAGHPDHDTTERVGALSRPDPDGPHPISACAAGDICVVARLATAETADTLSAVGDPMLLEAWTMPEPLLPVAIEARSRSDEDKLSTALARLAAEDPTLTVRQSPETGQLVLWCMGAAHADVVIARLRERFGVEVTRAEPRVPLRETPLGAARATGRHVKQSGGHGQYAICQIALEPLPTGSGREFVDEVVGGAVPRHFIPSVEKGVGRQLDAGVLAGHPMVDLRVRLVDGKSHPVDSSDVAFQIAGALAVKEAAHQAGIALLEPMLAVCVLVPDDHVGAVTSDLASRRGRVVGLEPQAGGRSAIRAEVPEIEMLRYAVDIQGLTQGTGTFTREHLRYEQMPEALAARALERDGGG